MQSLRNYNERLQLQLQSPSPIPVSVNLTDGSSPRKGRRRKRNRRNFPLFHWEPAGCNDAGHEPQDADEFRDWVTVPLRRQDRDSLQPGGTATPRKGTEGIIITRFKLKLTYMVSIHN